ncbi:quinone-dependent dihydroorotate dehydrogenase [Alicyclobacillus ferrooxydans]|uniref:Dihydroorotate dehydrogenase (quinone) n=1 Tax=Alicyclobacillus ferrooxydans TaxID=471514 RepID=A0A0P9CV78_9BACL|nr:quinone-dependent dihydroorotate dehydrogenase [Alicyclobacillus ferrooxydans]KPV43590.1 hypothetical protein AN477_11280 [Alicyclobacillus ferrooxydans]
MYQRLRPMLFKMDAEKAHTFTLHTLSRMPSLARMFGRQASVQPMLSQRIWGLDFSHPIGLAAGLDKNGEAVNAFLNMGFSFVEVGTVTPRPQPGNPKPRMFRLIDDFALINRMGFNNEGADRLLERLQSRKSRGLVGVNLGKNKVTENHDAANDYTLLVSKLYSVADFFVINVSSPNTPGLRDLQAADSLIPLVQAVLDERDVQVSRGTMRVRNGQAPVPPVLVKLAPDLADDAIALLAQRLQQIGVDGFIATNTTIARPNLTSEQAHQSGGLSGLPLKERSTQVVSIVYAATNGQVPVIASGGVFTARDAYEKVKAGASLVELYTALIYKGPEAISEIVRELPNYLRQDGFSSLSEAVGSGHRMES